MAANPLQIIQWLDGNGKPYSGGSLTFTITGTQEPAAVYTSPDESTSLGATVDLDSAGRTPVLWLDNRTAYTILLKDKDGTPINTYDNLLSITVPATSGSAVDPEWANSTSDLDTVPASGMGYKVVLGYSSPFDGGGGSFAWDKDSTASADEGLVFKPSSIDPSAPGRWVRVWNEPFVNVAWFGVIPSLDTSGDPVDLVAAVSRMTASTGAQAVKKAWFPDSDIAYTAGSEIDLSAWRCKLDGAFTGLWTFGGVEGTPVFTSEQTVKTGEVKLSWYPVGTYEFEPFLLIDRALNNADVIVAKNGAALLVNTTIVGGLSIHQSFRTESQSVFSTGGGQVRFYDIEKVNASWFSTMAAWASSNGNNLDIANIPEDYVYAWWGNTDYTMYNARSTLYVEGALSSGISDNTGIIYFTNIDFNGNAGSLGDSDRVRPKDGKGKRSWWNSNTGTAACLASLTDIDLGGSSMTVPANQTGKVFRNGQLSGSDLLSCSAYNCSISNYIHYGDTRTGEYHDCSLSFSSNPEGDFLRCTFSRSGEQNVYDGSSFRDCVFNQSVRYMESGAGSSLAFRMTGCTAPAFDWDDGTHVVSGRNVIIAGNSDGLRHANGNGARMGFRGYYVGSSVSSIIDAKSAVLNGAQFPGVWEGYVDAYLNGSSFTASTRVMASAQLQFSFAQAGSGSQAGYVSYDLGDVVLTASGSGYTLSWAGSAPASVSAVMSGFTLDDTGLPSNLTSATLPQFSTPSGGGGESQNIVRFFIRPDLSFGETIDLETPSLGYSQNFRSSETKVVADTICTVNGARSYATGEYDVNASGDGVSLYFDVPTPDGAQTVTNILTFIQRRA